MKGRRMKPIKNAARIATAVYLTPLLIAGQLFGSTLQEQNKAIARRAFDEILSRGRYELTEQLYAKDFVNHGIRSNTTLEEDQAALKGWHAAFPDVVTIYWIARGTNTGTGNGLPATGKKAELAGITIWRIVDGKIKEEWTAFDQLSMMKQLGLLSAN